MGLGLGMSPDSGVKSPPSARAFRDLMISSARIRSMEDASFATNNSESPSRRSGERVRGITGIQSPVRPTSRSELYPVQPRIVAVPPTS